MFVKSELGIIRTAMQNLLEKTQLELQEEDHSEETKTKLEQKLIQGMAIKNKISNLAPDLYASEEMLDEKSPVLVVDDDLVSREININMLWEMGFANVLSAHDGFEALTVLKRQSNQNEPVRLILCDWNMPNMSGLELLQQIRKDKENWQTPFFLVTANHDKAHILTAIKSGVTGYVVKPVVNAQLIEKLKRYIPKQS